MFKKSLFRILLALTVASGYSQTVAYVTNDQSHNVSVIDTATNVVTATIPVGKNPSGVIFSPDGSRAYVMNTGENTISIINTATATVIGTFPLGGESRLGPELVALTPDGKKLYVALETGSVVVINTTTNSVIARIPVPSAGAVLISRDGTRAYVQTVLTDGVFVIDTAKDAVIAHIPVKSNFSVGIAESPDGRKIYASGGVHVSQITIIDSVSNTITATIPFKGGPQGIAITSDGSRAYVANELTDSVNIVNLKTNTVEPVSIQVGKNPALVALTPDGKCLYVTNFQLGEVGPQASTVSVINTSTNKVIATVPVGQIPAAIAVGHLNSPFASLVAEGLDVSNHQVDLRGNFTLGSNSPGLDLAHQSLSVTVGNFDLVIPAGTFEPTSKQKDFVFRGTVSGLKVNLDLKTETGKSGSFNYKIQIKGVDVNTVEPVAIGLRVGPNSGTAAPPAKMPKIAAKQPDHK